MKKILVIIISLLMLLAVGCSSSDTSSKTDSTSSKVMEGQSVTLSQAIAVATTQENLNKMASFLNAKNKEAYNKMVANKELIILPPQTKVTVIKINFASTEIEVDSGQYEKTKGFTYLEVIK